MKETWKHTLTACSLKLATDFMRMKNIRTLYTLPCFIEHLLSFIIVCSVFYLCQLPCKD